MTNLCVLLISLFVAHVFCQDSRPVVTIPDGQIQGIQSQTIGENKTYYAFRGIPYAKPPIGNLRFADPVKNDPWTDVLDASEDKSNCTQVYPSIVAIGKPFIIVGSEDCLFMNVYTTDLNGSLPVLLWIHGGGFISGSSSYKENGPDYILDKDVVFVAFNYRLGVFGFLSTEDNIAPGNWGLKDQILALNWVKQNIKYFGGDPEKITIFGESAGGASVAYILEANQTKGLYRGAIMDSGSSLCLWALTRDAKVSALEYGLSLGIVTIDEEKLITQLRQKNAGELKSAENNLTVSLFLSNGVLGGVPFGVVKEPNSEGAVFTGKSHEMLSQGEFNQVPLLIGFNSNEAGLLDDYVNIAIQILYQYDLAVFRLAPYDLTDDLIRRIAAGQDIRNYFCDNSSLTSHPEAVGKIVTMDQFNRPIREGVHLFSKYVDVYYYRFSYQGKMGNPNRNYKGVGHAEELNYIFISKNPSDPADDEIRDKTVTMWTNFVKYLNPTPPNSSEILEDIIWEPNTSQVDTNTTVKFLNINETISMDTNPSQDQWEFYKGIYDEYGKPPYDTY